jgi:N-acetylglucosaminyldiphosphoundecaprenol N-acetyl-beta-D-mannosaminyltransferase
MSDCTKILGIRIDGFSRENIEDWVRGALDGEPKQKFIATLNAEIILKGYRDKKYAAILNGADLNLCDGFGPRLASWVLGKRIKSRYTGVDLVDFALKSAKERNFNVLVVAAKNSLSRPEKIENSIKEKYGIQAQAEYFDERIFQGEAAKAAQIVFSNFGAPEQEKFLSRNREKFPNAKILAGVGGTFDFLTGKMKRAPVWMRKIGIEWLFRFIQEPKRAKRIWSAVFVFPILAVFSRK